MCSTRTVAKKFRADVEGKNWRRFTGTDAARVRCLLSPPEDLRMDSKNKAVRYIVSATPSARARASTSFVGMVSSTTRVRLSGVRVPLTRYTFFDDGRRNRPIARGRPDDDRASSSPVSAGVAARLKADSEAGARPERRRRK